MKERARNLARALRGGRSVLHAAAELALWASLAYNALRSDYVGFWMAAAILLLFLLNRIADNYRSQKGNCDDKN